MLKDHKSAMHLEGVTFDKVIRNSNKTEHFLKFLLFYNCQLEIIRFIHSFDNMFLFYNHTVTYMNLYCVNVLQNIDVSSRAFKFILIFRSLFFRTCDCDYSHSH